MHRRPPYAAALLALLTAATTVAPALRAQETGSQDGPDVLRPGIEVADVRIDGHVLFPVRGIVAYPAERRAAEIEGRIRDVARDPTVRSEAVRHETTPGGVEIWVGDHRILTLNDADADLVRASPEQIGWVYADRIRVAIEEWREARDAGRLLVSGGLVLLGAALLAAFLLLLRRLDRGLGALYDRRWARKALKLEAQSTRVVRAERIRDFVLGVARLLLALLALVAVYAYLQTALGAFPWTRGIADSLLAWVVDPVYTIGRGILAALPGLLFIAVAWVFTRFLLRTIRAFFEAVERGTAQLRGFEPEWARPTYRLVRAGVVLLFLVMIFPYIPGSSTDAFKGVTLFLGVVVSLGSTSFISNIIAGYTMTYRRAFRIGDRIRVGDEIGDVEETRLMVTHLRTTKNEEVIVPNTVILGGNVTNFSSLARREGLILHTTVGIGYETPWRQVEAMLLEAARRTPGLEPAPPPFVHQKTLGDFAVTYEINAYTRDARNMAATYTALHANIQDVFNEYGVQIMTPAYEGDPEIPKIVPREAWFAAPARQDPPVPGRETT